MVGAEASRMGVNGPWITKSYLEMVLERKGHLLDAVLLLFCFSILRVALDLSVQNLIV